MVTYMFVVSQHILDSICTQAYTEESEWVDMCHMR